MRKDGERKGWGGEREERGRREGRERGRRRVAEGGSKVSHKSRGDAVFSCGMGLLSGFIV